MKALDSAALATLVGAAQQSPRRRANRNLHDQLGDPVQRLAIAMEPDTVVQVHRHPQTFELLFPLHGRFVVLHFDAVGTVTDRRVLGEDCALIETPAGCWHAVLSLDPGGVIFEVKQGPYVPVTAAATAPWSVVAPEATGGLLDWYARAQPGERFPGI